MALIPVTLAADPAAATLRGKPCPGRRATCTLCGHSAAAAFEEGRKARQTDRVALATLARTCPGETIHCYYPDALPAGVRLEYLHRGRRLPCHLIGRTVVGGGGAIAANTRVYVIAETEAAATPARRLAAALKPRASVNRKTQKKRITPGYDTAVEAPLAAGA